MFTKSGVLGTLTALAVVGQLSAPAMAQTPYYHGYVQRHHGPTHYKVKGYLASHPKVKSTVVGAGVGTAAGAVAGLVSGRGIMRGALIGAGTGAGVGLIRSSRIMKAHPVLQDAATGSAAGLGLGLASSRTHHAGLKGAAVGGAVGLGLGALKDVLK